MSWPINQSHKNNNSKLRCLQWDEIEPRNKRNKTNASNYSVNLIFWVLIYPNISRKLFYVTWYIEKLEIDLAASNKMDYKFQFNFV